jgi:hypothetical protein
MTAGDPAAKKIVPGNNPVLWVYISQHFSRLRILEHQNSSRPQFELLL